jgi:hypothetical protein
VWGYIYPMLRLITPWKVILYETRILFMNKYCRRCVILCNILNKLVQIKSH